MGCARLVVALEIADQSEPNTRRATGEVESFSVGQRSNGPFQSKMIDERALLILPRHDLFQPRPFGAVGVHVGICICKAERDTTDDQPFRR